MYRYFNSFFFFTFKDFNFIVLLTCVASDIGGFVFGKVFKGPKLTKISPNKTISGAIGSLIFSSLFILLLTNYLSKSFDLNIIIVEHYLNCLSNRGLNFFIFKEKIFFER